MVLPPVHARWDQLETGRWGPDPSTPVQPDRPLWWPRLLAAAIVVMAAGGVIGTVLGPPAGSGSPADVAAVTPRAGASSSSPVVPPGPAPASPGPATTQLIEGPTIRSPEADSGHRVADPPVTGTVSATAPTITATDPPPGATARERGEAALASISYPWRQRLEGWTIVFLDGRSGLYGLTLVDQRRIEIYVRHGQDQDLLTHIVAHEIGHAVDVSLNDGPARRRWQDLRGIGSAPWWPEEAASDFRTGAGDFAECFAAWQTSSQYFRSELGSRPTTVELELLAALAGGH